MLDCGVVGIQMPRTESREQLMELTEYVKFAPIGSRPGAPCYGNVDYSWASTYALEGRSWLGNANGSTMMIAHIESERGYLNAEELITTPHLDVVYIGPYDFSISMGYPGEYDHPKIASAMQEILNLCKKHNKPFGVTPSGAASAEKWMAAGAQFFYPVDELALLDAGARRCVSDYYDMAERLSR